MDTRVKVNITHPEYYSKGAARSLNGKTGVIIENRNDLSEPKILVKFDTPFTPWWSGQLPGNMFWFAYSDLQNI